MGIFNRLPPPGQPSAGSHLDTADEEAAARLLETGIALEQEGRKGEALRHYEQAIALVPNLARAHFCLGNLLLEQGEASGALEAYAAALAHKPDSAAAHFNKGNAHASLGQHAAAIEAYGNALRLKPDFADAELALGVALENLGRFAEATAHYRRVLDISPGYAEAHFNLGGALQRMGQLPAAVASYQRALEGNPGFAEAHYRLGTILLALGRHEQTILSYRRAIEANPGHADAHNSLGVVLNLTGKYDEAVAHFRQAVSIEPGFLQAHVNLGSVLKDIGQLDGALESTQRALRIDPDYPLAHSNLLFIQNYLGDLPASRLLADARRYGEAVARFARPYVAWPNVPEPDRCLRVGFVSGDLCDHPVGYFVEGVLAALSSGYRGWLELHAYPCGPCHDAISARIRSSCHGWHPAAGQSDEALAGQIHGHGIDVLIDLSGHTAHGRLPVFAWKPAPVQVSWLGYFATTGVAAIDYFIADPWTLPEREETSFTEKVWRLPETRLCFTPPEAEAAVATLPALANGYLTFGCFNNLTKMNDAVVALWARILAKVPDSRLFLKSRQLGEFNVRKDIEFRFSAHGIDPRRLLMEGHSSRSEYLAAYQRVDIALDPFPYPGGTTTVEALWMGVPVLTLSGERFLARQGVGLLMNAGLPDWVASDPDDYVARAVWHAVEPDRLASLRGRLRDQVQASPLFDAARFARHFESALRSMWALWCERRN